MAPVVLVSLLLISVGSARAGFNFAAPSEMQEPSLGSVKKSAKGDVDMVYVSAGEFTMGSDAAADEKPKRTVYLDGYWIGKNDVTVAQFRAYCDSTSYKYNWAAQKPKWDWKDDHPMVNVNWDEARAFCKWAADDLPTEAQWEKAARGTDGREYPWGSEFNPRNLWWSKDGQPGSAGSTAPVGSHPKGASPYGCLDMAGNVWQWCLDWYDASGYDKDGNKNPTGPTLGKDRVLRGGGWYYVSLDFFRCAYRVGSYPSNQDANFGFRVAGRM